MIKTLLCVSISSLVLLLPIHGQIREGGAIAHYYPKIQKTLPDIPLKPQEAAQPAVVPQAVVYTPPVQTTPTNAKSYALSQVGSVQFACLDALWTKESGWRVDAYNSSGAYGIPQSLPASKMAASGADYLTNPITQVNWGLSYIASSYGTACGAWAHSQSYNWY